MRERMIDQRMAPEGHIWRCAVCGKYAVDQCGIEGYHSGGWDESCTLAAVLVKADNLPMDAHLAIAAQRGKPD